MAFNAHKEQPNTVDPRTMKARCDECPLSRCRPVLGKGPLDASLAFIADAPGQWDLKRGEPLVGAPGVKFDEVLYHAGTRRKDVRITYAVLCRPEVAGETGKRRYDIKLYMAWLRRENKSRKKLKQEQIADPFACCYPRLRWELWQMDRWAWRRGAPNGVVVSALGNFALKQLTGMQGILKYRGSVLQPASDAVEPAVPLEQAP